MPSDFLSFCHILLLVHTNLASLQIVNYSKQEGKHLVVSDTSQRDIKTARSYSDCLMKCQVSKCKSLNFDKVTKECTTITYVGATLSTDENKVYATRVAPATCSMQQEWLPGVPESGVYMIKPEGRDDLDVYCDMKTDGGVWTVFQRRVDDSVDFYRTFSEYEETFGDPSGNYWIGNKNLLALTEHKPHQLLIQLEDFEGEKRFALYSDFYIDNSAGLYTIHVSGYSGDAGDGMAHHNGRPFATWDHDPGGEQEDEMVGSIYCRSISKRYEPYYLISYGGISCAQTYKGAWWYNACHYANLNGMYLGGFHDGYGQGINWSLWRDNTYSLKRVAMLMRPK